MGWTQTVAPNMGTKDYPGWCERFVWNAFNRVAVYGANTARQSWDKSAFKHATRELPGVAVPGYWSWVGTIEGITQDWGHAAVILPDGRVLTSPLSWSAGYNQQIVGSIEEVSRILGATWLGWTEDQRGGRVVAWTDSPTPAPAPTPSPAGTQVVIQPGMTLWGLAEQYYGNGARYMEIFNASNFSSGNPSLIFPGEIAIIP
jgi:nucleoid-associated protein YgaU